MIGSTDVIGNATTIGSLPIDPAAEPSKGQQAPVSSQQEVEFYRQSQAEFELENNRQNLGWLGGIFGGKESAPTNIVGLAVGVALFGLLVSAFCAPTQSMADLQKYLGGIITTGIGFLAGTATSSKK